MPLIGVGATKQQLPDDWGKNGYRTLKSSQGYTRAGSVEIHFWPSVDTFASLRPSGTHTLVLEWASYGGGITCDLSGWARHNRAFHFDTKTELEPALSVEAIALYQRIDRNGNNSWLDAPGKRDALRDLRLLRDLGELEPADLVGYMIGRHSPRAIKQLIALVAKV